MHRSATAATPLPHTPPAARAAARRDVEIVVPVHNEERGLARSIMQLHRYLQERFPFTFRITIADNASTDATAPIARTLADALEHVRVVRLEQKGRGRALRETWLHSTARVVCYMDVDLSTDLAALLPLVAPLISGHSDVAIGTRLTSASRVVRGPRRELISRSYNRLLHLSLGARFSDAQCGFKAMRTDCARRLLPLVEDDGWFFDTELLVLAEQSGMRIHEVPVDWVDDTDSSVDIVATAVADLRGVLRLGRGLASGRLPVARLRSELGRAPLDKDERVAQGGSLGAQTLRFAAIGAFSTLAYLLIYLVLRSGLSPQPSNLIALLATTLGNTAANRRLTFGVRGRHQALRAQLQGLVVLAVGIALTSGALAMLHLVSPTAPRAYEVSVLVAANLAVTVLRFVAMRTWIFRRADVR